MRTFALDFKSVLFPVWSNRLWPYIPMFYNPAASAATIAWLVGLGIILDGVSYWVRVAAVNRVQKKMHRIADHIRRGV